MGYFRPVLATRYTPNRGLLGLSRQSLERLSEKSLEGSRRSVLVAPKAAKWALVGPVLSACGSQEGGLSEFSDSLSRNCLKSLADDGGVVPRRAKTRRFQLVSTPHTGQIRGRDVARTTFHTVSRRGILGSWTSTFTAFSEVRIQQYGYFRCSTSLNGTFDGT